MSNEKQMNVAKSDNLSNAVFGRGRDKILGFMPTRHELVQLAEYWHRAALDLRWFWFMYPVASSDDYQLRAFIGGRIARIVDLVGEEEVNQAADEVREEYENICPILWEIFEKGSREEWDVIQKAVSRRLDKIDAEHRRLERKAPDADCDDNSVP